MTMTRKLALTTLLFAAGVLADVTRSRAAELVMFEDAACCWCQQAPLRRIHIRDQEMSGGALTSRVNATPTFVLAQDGREIGRIVGYPGSDFFYPRVDELLKQLPPSLPDPSVRQPSERSAANSHGVCRV